MSNTPIRIPSVYPGSLIKLIIQPAGTVLEVTIMDNGRQMAMVNVSVDGFAQAIGQLPGFTAKYTPPIEVPTYLGAVIERGDNRWVRINHNDETSMPWARSTSRYSNDDIAAVIANGGYEREPEFPTRSP